MNTKIVSKKGLDWSSLIGSLMIKITWKGIVSCENSKSQRFGCKKHSGGKSQAREFKLQRTGNEQIERRKKKRNADIVTIFWSEDSSNEQKEPLFC